MSDLGTFFLRENRSRLKAWGTDAWLKRDGRSLGWRVLSLVLLFGLIAPALVRGENIPPKPERYFNDYAGAVSVSSATALNRELEQFERETSNQLVVAVYRKMDSASSIEDYTVRIAQKWGVGQKEKKNGAVLFVFVDDHQAYIQVGYGLEPVLTDAYCRQIIDNEIIPRFRAGDISGGLSAGVHAMMSAAQGEYRGTGQTNAEARGNGHGGSRGGGLSVMPIAFFVIVMLVFGSFSRTLRRQDPRRSWGTRNDDRFGPGGGFGGFGGFGGGGGSGGGSSGGGGFSGGGGSFGGGGAGGSW